RAGRLAHVAVDLDPDGHEVLRDAGARVAVHAHGCELVHAGAVVADVPVDLHLDVGIAPAGARVGDARVDDAPVPRPGRLGELVQAPVQLAHRGRGEIDHFDGSVLALGDR